jgi:hypothetical protein
MAACELSHPQVHVPIYAGDKLCIETTHISLRSGSIEEDILEEQVMFTETAASL